jgi:hypothetical protein
MVSASRWRTSFCRIESGFIGCRVGRR